MISIYKIPDGKPENTFAFSGEAKNKKYATEIIHECHEAWKRLALGETPAKTATYDLSIKNVTIQNSPGFTTPQDAAYTQLPSAAPKPPASIDPSGMALPSGDCSEADLYTVSKWFYISSAQV